MTHIYSDQASASLGCLENVSFVHINSGFIRSPGKLASGR